MNVSARLIALSCILAAPLIAQQAGVPALPGVPKAVQQAADSIDPEKIRAHVRFLASDLLEGRGPGVRGGNIAAEYIATQFALDGLKPPATMEPIFRMSRSTPCTPSRIRPASPSSPKAAPPSR